MGDTYLVVGGVLGLTLLGLTLRHYIKARRARRELINQHYCWARFPDFPEWRCRLEKGHAEDHRWWDEGTGRGDDRVETWPKSEGEIVAKLRDQLEGDVIDDPDVVRLLLSGPLMVTDGKIERLEPPGWPSTYHNPNDPPCTCGEDPHDKECPADDD